MRNVAGLNLSYFGIEFAVALAIGSVALFADSVDFLEDGAVNLLILAGLGFSAARRAKLGMLLAAIILVPALATIWTAWHNVTTGLVPEPVPLSVTGFGALDVNIICARMLAHFVVAGLLTAATASRWPDLIVGLGIAALNANAAHEVFEAARAEHAAAKP